jgi:hypothetical protein
LIDSIFNRCKISKISNKSDEIVSGGGIYGNIESNGTFSIIDNDIEKSTSTFNGCNAYEGYGGAIAIYGSKEVSGIVFGGKGLSFLDCSALFGKHIFIGSDDFDSVYDKIAFDYDYNLSDVNNLIGINEGIPTAPMIVLYFFLS